VGEALRGARGRLLAALAHLEAYIDFPDEDIGPATGAELAAQVGAVRDELARLLETADQGRLLREGVRTVLAGAPNVGKSSLLNVLLGFDRAIVSEAAGTTRDTIEEVVNVEGFPLRLVDTAGIREGGDEVEREGVARSRRQLANADLVLEVLDASLGRDQPRVARAAAPGARWVTVLNKADLPEHPDWGNDPAVRVSCLRRTGTAALGRAAAEAVTSGHPPGEGGGSAVAINARHQRCLSRAVAHLDATLAGLRAGLAPEFTAVDLRAALDAVGEAVGVAGTEELLGEIFSRFCIGK
jgi:tRNA modification GTPase